MQNIEKSFQKGLKSLEEINILGGQELTPLVGAASHHFSELKRNALKSLEENKNFEKLNSFLASHLEAVFLNYIKESDSITQAQIYFQDHTWGHKEWNSIINIVPEMLSILTLLKVQKNIQLIQEKETFILRGWIDHDFRVESGRPQIYALFRKLLENQILMTYKLHHNLRENESVIEIKFDLSHDDEQAYSVSSGNRDHNIEFSNLFKNYELNDREDLPDYKHKILIIDDEFILKKEDACISDILDREGERKSVYQVIHFSFLFQPITMILPERGKVEIKSSDKNRYLDIFQMILQSN